MRVLFSLTQLVTGYIHLSGCGVDLSTPCWITGIIAGNGCLQMLKIVNECWVICLGQQEEI